MPRIMASLAAGSIGRELAALADALRPATVQVRIGRGGGGEGSGVVWRNDGVIVTNAHVARGARAEVRLWDGRSLEARIVARDPDSDLAALQVPGALTPIARGDPSAILPGELVVALGHPLGVAHAVALGVVHQVLRADDGGACWMRADIRLAPGNSGGPLVDVAGRLLGVNTLIAGGLGHAVALPVIESFLRRAGLGSSGERAA
jgi:serine protease Do